MKKRQALLKLHLAVLLAGATGLFGRLLVLAGICTIGQYLLQFDALKDVSAFTVNLTYNLEPIYSIIFAMILFGEARELNFSFYLGLAIIITAVVLQNLTVRRTDALGVNHICGQGSFSSASDASASTSRR